MRTILNYTGKVKAEFPVNDTMYLSSDFFRRKCGISCEYNRSQEMWNGSLYLKGKNQFQDSALRWTFFKKLLCTFYCIQ